MNLTEANTRRLRVLEAISKAQTAHVNGFQEEALSLVEKVLPELRSAAEYDSRDSNRWAVTIKAWASVGEFLEQLQVLKASLMLWEGIHDGLVGRLEPEELLLITIKARLARALYSLRDLERARDLEEEILAAQVRHLPPDHPDLISAMGNLAGTLFSLGNLAGARDLQEKVLAGQTRILPPDHPHRLISMGNLAVTAQTQGDLGLARELIEEVVTVQTRQLRPDHPTLLLSKGNLAGILKSHRELVPARKIEEEVLAAQARLLPPDHPHLLNAKGQLAITLKDLGNFQRARELQEEVLAAQTRLLKVGHQDILTAKGNLAVTVMAQGDLGRARDLQEEVLTAQTALLPADHPHLLTAKGNLAATAAVQGDLDRAQELQVEVLASRFRHLPPDHPDTLIAKGNLAGTLKSRGDLEQARDLTEEVLVAQTRLLPTDHLELLRAKGNLAALVKSQGDLEWARNLEEEVLAAQARLLPPNHQDRLTAMGNLAGTVKAQGDLSQSNELVESLFDRSLAVTLGAQACAPREAGSILQGVVARFALLRFLSTSDKSTSALFRGVETLRAIAVPSVQRRHFFREHPEHQDLQWQLRETGSTLNALAAGPSGGEELQEWQERFREWARLRDKLEEKLSQALKEAGIQVDPITHEIVAARLGKAVLVSFFRYIHWESDEQGRPVNRGPSLLAHVLEPDGTLHQVELGTIESLIGVVTAWRSTLGPLKERLNKKERQHIAKEPIFGAQVRERLLDPIIEALGGWDTFASFARLIVIPDDIVHLIPFDALTIPDRIVETPDGKVMNHRLFDAIPVQVEMSLRRLLEEELPLAEGTGLLSVGGVHYDSRGSKERTKDENTPLAYLPGTRTEMEAISKAFEERRGGNLEQLTEAAATVDAVKSSVQGKRVVHLATHGWFGLIPAEALGNHSRTGLQPEVGHARFAREFAPLSLCGLAFAGAGDSTEEQQTRGRVTGEELATWELEACELVLLSACQTNVGSLRPGQGIQSLQTAVHAAGARTALTSLWPVPDLGTAELAVAFCEIAFDQEKKVPALDALHQAKQSLRDKGRPASAWAGWVLTGDPGPLGGVTWA